MRYVVCYDIRDNARRRHVSRCLDGFGDRLQGSVFELVVDRALFDRCFNQLAQLIDHDEDSIAAYALCESCAGRRAYLGVAQEQEPIGEERVFIV